MLCKKLEQYIEGMNATLFCEKIAGFKVSRRC